MSHGILSFCRVSPLRILAMVKRSVYRLKFKRGRRSDGSVLFKVECRALDFEASAISDCRCWDCQNQLDRALICACGAAALRSGASMSSELSWRTFDRQDYSVDLGFLDQVERLNDQPWADFNEFVSDDTWRPISECVGGRF